MPEAGHDGSKPFGSSLPSTWGGSPKKGHSNDDLASTNEGNEEFANQVLEDFDQRLTTLRNEVHDERGEPIGIDDGKDAPATDLADGFVYTGQWKGERREGTGVLQRPDGGKYTGQFAADQAHGFGILTHANGDQKNKTT